MQFQSESDEYSEIVAINIDKIATTNAVKRKIIAFVTQLKQLASTTDLTILTALLNSCVLQYCKASTSLEANGTCIIVLKRLWSARRSNSGDEVLPLHSIW